MPSIKWKGVEIHFDTFDEAIAAAERLASGSGGARGDDAAKTNGAGPLIADGRWTVSRFRDYVGRLSQPQTRMLQELVRTPHGRTAKDLAQVLGFQSAKAFGPVMAAMSKHARNAGIDFAEVLTSDRIVVGRD